ncbi:MAG: hypothetical protein GY720_14800 [bacterium]|nr:hypothetical protein [bacterium]
MSVSDGVLERICTLLRRFQNEPDDRADVGRDAVALWWELDELEICGTQPIEPWEEALLDLAAWHTADARLRYQRADNASVARHLAALAS